MELTEEQKNNIIEAFNALIDIVKDIWKKIKQAFINFIKDFKKIKKIQKYSNIYIRTHNKRIKKKQLKKIRELFI